MPNLLSRWCLTALIAIQGVTFATPASPSVSEFASALGAIPLSARIGANPAPFLKQDARRWMRDFDYPELAGGQIYRNWHPRGVPFAPDGSADIWISYDRKVGDYVIVRIEAHFVNPKHYDATYLPDPILAGIDFESERGQRRILSALSLWLPKGFKAATAAKRTITKGATQYASGGERGALVEFDVYPAEVTIGMYHPGWWASSRRPPSNSARSSAKPPVSTSTPSLAPRPTSAPAISPSPDWYNKGIDDTLEQMRRRPSAESSIRPPSPGLSLPGDATEYGPSAPTDEPTPQ